ncbi:MAG: apolipoprotein N-acyltransferase, partial [Actinomycetota bacterium]|nr:apolipoprotein N-acyltransferase [Actinomycetota bacterium]
LKTAGIGGGWLVAALLVLVNALLLEAVLAARDRSWRPCLAAAMVLLGVAAAPLLVSTPSADGPSLRVAIVQGNVPDTEPSFEKDLRILESHVARTKELAGSQIDLVVWPESSVGIDPFRNPDVAASMSEAADAVDAPLIVGGNLDIDDERYQVMAYLVEPGQGIVERYQKTHLVPFGEYVPGRRFLDWLPILDQVPRDAVAGKERTLFHPGGGAVAPVLSFEGDFGSLVRRRIADGGRLLVVATNTSTWGHSWASAQHAAFSQVRAAENGVWVVHAALSGISEFISPDGTVTAKAGLYEPATLIEDLRFAGDITFYARSGDWFPLGALAASVLWLLWVTVTAKRRSSVT